jgi:Rieske Fe-S protein
MSVDESLSVEEPMSSDGSLVPRRAVLAGAGMAVVALAAGCATYDATGAPAAPPAGAAGPAGGGAAGGAGAGGAGAAGGGAAKALVSAAKVPVGGGVITDQGVVVTQPTAGTFLGFTTVCTHQGCQVSGVSGGLITCPCHGSAFKIADGSVARGPANKPLAPVTVQVNGADIELA